MSRFVKSKPESRFVRRSKKNKVLTVQHRTVLDRKDGGIYGPWEIVRFENSVDECDSSSTIVLISGEKYDDLGKPEKITVSIVPEDLLNV